jgi:pSer/pThr/pTyr-binding forkhead associated (FHA) protein
VRKAETSPQALFRSESGDHELQAQYGMNDANSKPAFLYVERGPGAGQLLELKQGTIIIGRASVSDLRLQHPSISRRHAQIRRIGDQFFVKDLGSQNGSFVNKTRIANEVEIRIGDTLALGNALLRLRGPMQKSERTGSPPPPPSKARSPASSVARAPMYSTGQHQAVGTTSGSNRMVKIAVFAGAMGFGLAGVLAIALVRMANTPEPKQEPGRRPAASKMEGAKTDASKEAAKKEGEKKETEKIDNDAIAEALKRKQVASAPVEPEAPRSAADPGAAPSPTPSGSAGNDEPSIDEGPATVKSAANGPSIEPAKSRSKKSKGGQDEESSPPKGGKRSQILSAYEKGNAEASLEAAKAAGEKELAEKLLKFMSAYDAGQEALVSNNGTLAIKEFTKALGLDEQLSSGFSSYTNEIRKNLGNLYFLVGKQYESNGDDDKAKSAYQASTKYDPANQKAKAALNKMSESSSSGDDEDPPPAPKPSKKAPSKSSIDDAFGD